MKLIAKKNVNWTLWNYLNTEKATKEGEKGEERERERERERETNENGKKRSER